MVYHTTRQGGSKENVATRVWLTRVKIRAHIPFSRTAPCAEIYTMNFEFDVDKSTTNKQKFMKAKDFDRKFDNGEDITAHLDFSRVRRPEQERKRVNVDFPLWMIQQLGKEAKRLGVPRQSIIKVWVAERLKKAS